jgi:hypothetical protein
MMKTMIAIAMAVPKPPQPRRKLEKSISICVGAGNALPNSENILEKTGITKMSSTVTRTMASEMTAIG